MPSQCELIWNNCLAFIKGQVNEQSFKTWFTPIVPKKLENNILTIQVPSQFFYEWLEEHYLGLLRQVIMQEIGPQGRLEYSIIVDQGNNQRAPVTINLPTQRNYIQGNNNQPSLTDSPHNPFTLKNFKDLHQASYLNPNYTFETFIEGDCNQLARSAAQAVAKKPGNNAFNPLMLYGKVGLGKTHIVQALGNEVKAHFSNKFVLYASSEQFTTQFIESLRNNSVQDFTHFYLQADVLILDDVQFLVGKEKTQEIFFHIFNHLHQSGKQIVMTSDCPPRDLKGLQERLLSRFKWGLTADLQQPDFETRIAIIKNKIQADGIDIGEDLVEYIAQSVDTNIRELEGVIISLIAHASLNKRDVDLGLAKQVLKNIVHDIDTEISIDYLHKIVTEHFNVSLESIKSKTRKKEIVIARQVAMYLAKHYTNHSLKSIGQYCGGRDHSTVIHAIQAVDDMLHTEHQFKASFEEIKRKVKIKLPQAH
ncbi:chromosomal replication initiator protein DnaA [Candidatus Amoebophilus asiaticus 5a2]|uniref:Chromosomal replication initiator protein DnaA n=1 Tax=Amoebophilus asiaticus (strain 5a2) TaxID=452471 RepID=B3EU40_AMOA5|nr:chromosomal replication initiator protein DnaA [Candidatus Amoebophilus asiaticus]ACE05459.1 chromosomal replication initiator protein DnaA [Candidatus Amoebophilus asiaticus 5a2]